jgi:hypothetical protein
MSGFYTVAKDLVLRKDERISIGVSSDGKVIFTIGYYVGSKKPRPFTLPESLIKTLAKEGIIRADTITKEIVLPNGAFLARVSDGRYSVAIGSTTTEILLSDPIIGELLTSGIIVSVAPGGDGSKAPEHPSRRSRSGSMGGRRTNRKSRKHARKSRKHHH